ncbi:hypothetical protein C8A05DRAFT_15227 [Staphylotrichum tortipilum]|uniref:Uncharacterized protein n=1 Tax=Staphylotrichum tortipilum TaxID=2831512 RepID=A0AAN6MMU6_9PEZI|nr:hypothetical protein C8A05DRAFT_15227 [Staphylotrichum longicolle]
MDATFVVVALAGLLVVALRTQVPAAYANVSEVMGLLLSEQQSWVDYITLITVLSLASLLASPFVSLWGNLPTAASKVRQALESSSSGATRRASLVRGSVVNAALGLINALGSTALAGILSWMFGRLVWPLLLLVLRPLLPVILRKYFFWSNWVESRFGDFVDAVCVDRRGLIEQRRVLQSRELVHGMQVAKLAELNVKVAQAARNAETVFLDALKHSKWHPGKYEHLRPSKFLGPVAAVVPGRDPLPRLGLWYRLFQRVNMDVRCLSEAIRRTESAMATNRASIADLEQQLTSRPAEIKAIKDQLEICKQELRDALRLEIAQREDSRRKRAALLAAKSQREARKRRDSDLTATMLTPPPVAIAHTTTTTTITVPAPTIATTTEPPPSKVAPVVAPAAAVVPPDPVAPIDITTLAPALDINPAFLAARFPLLPGEGYPPILVQALTRGPFPRSPVDPRAAEKKKVREVFRYLNNARA